MIFTQNEEYFATGLKYSVDNGITPLITILCTKEGQLAIFADNDRLTHDQKVQVLQMAAHMAATGVREERKGMLTTKTNFKIHK